MGVEHALACENCKEWIDLHKCYSLNLLAQSERPPTGCPAYDERFNLVTATESYWNSRGIWFLFKHIGHKVDWFYDSYESYHSMCEQYKEVFSYDDDCQIREQTK